MELRPLIPWGRTTAVVIVLPFVGHLLTASLVAQMAKRLPAMRETWVLFLGQEDPLEKEMAIHSSTLAWKIPWTEEPGRLHVVHGVAKSRTRLSDFTSLHHIFKSSLFSPLSQASPNPRRFPEKTACTGRHTINFG